MRDLKQACKDYFHKGFEDFIYTSPVSGIVILNTPEGRFKQIIYLDEGKMCFGEVETIGTIGRPKTIDYEAVQKLKNEGMTQEQISRELNVSLSTVRRNWK